MQDTEEGVEFDVPLSEADRVNMLAIEKDADVIVKLLGRYRRGIERTSIDSGFAHLMGAGLIGTDASNSVVDSHCRRQCTTHL